MVDQTRNHHDPNHHGIHHTEREEKAPFLVFGHEPEIKQAGQCGGKQCIPFLNLKTMRQEYVEIPTDPKDHKGYQGGEIYFLGITWLK